MARSRDLEFSGFFLLLSIFHLCLVGLSLYVGLTFSFGRGVLHAAREDAHKQLHGLSSSGAEKKRHSLPPTSMGEISKKSLISSWSCSHPGPHTVGSQGMNALVCIPCQPSQRGGMEVGRGPGMSCSPRNARNDRQKVPQSKRSWADPQSASVTDGQIRDHLMT